MHRFDRITHSVDVMGGKACVRGMRVTVSMLLGIVASGQSFQDILEDFPYLECEDILQSLQYAAWLIDEKEVVFPES